MNKTTEEKCAVALRFIRLIRRQEKKYADALRNIRMISCFENALKNVNYLLDLRNGCKFMALKSMIFLLFILLNIEPYELQDC